MAAEYQSELERLRYNLVTVVETYAKHQGISNLTALNRVAGAAHASAVWAGGDIKAGSYDKWMASFSDAWPADLPWPEGVPRPPRKAEAA